MIDYSACDIGEHGCAFVGDNCELTPECGKCLEIRRALTEEEFSKMTEKVDV